MSPLAMAVLTWNETLLNLTGEDLRRVVLPVHRAVLRQRPLRRLPRRLELPEHRATLQERRLRQLGNERDYEEGGLRVRRVGPGRLALSACFSLCLFQQSAHRHSTMKVPSPAGRRERRQPNFGLIRV